MFEKDRNRGKNRKRQSEPIAFHDLKTDKGKFAQQQSDSNRTVKTKVTLVKCILNTGRTHQIRVHMEGFGHPIVGDALYKRGSPRHLREKLCQGRHYMLFHYFLRANKEISHDFSVLPPDDLKNR